jgi:hypothetical protein
MFVLMDFFLTTAYADAASHNFGNQIVGIRIGELFAEKNR